MKTLIATATQATRAEFKASRLFKSLQLHENNTVTSFDLEPTYKNTSGLCSVYNNYLTPQNLKDKDTIIFVHDDVFIDSINFVDTVNDFLHNNNLKDKFAVVGLAGGSNIQKKKPFLWHLVTKKETQSGIVFHPHTGFNFPTVFGPTPKEVAVLDGLFLAVNVKKLQENNITFDENIKGFHQYDMKFCIDCKKAGLKLTTVPINVIHNSPGLSNVKDKTFLQAEEYILNSISSH